MRYLRLTALLTIPVAFALAQDEPAPSEPPAPATAPAAAPAAPAPGGRGGNGEQQPRPYDRVITKEAKTSEGVFKVHQVGTRHYYEIPKDELGKEFLWVNQIARNTIGAGNGGQAAGSLVVKWERHGNRVLLRSVNYEITANPADPVAKAVEASNTPAIIMSFNVEAVGANDAPVIDVTRLFTTDVPEFSARARLRARGMDASRSFIERITPFPQNIEVEATQTYTAPTDAQPGGRGAAAGGMRPGSGTVVMHFSMVKLPEKPMMPRLFDERVGFFTTSQLDFSRPEHRADRRSYIARWRLEKKDPTAALSEPVKPIVYYLDPATPKQWIPYLKRGIESWQPAFEAAGFKNAIIAKEAPTAEEDPNWSPEDVRYSVVRWLPSTIENAQGPHISDPRTGEILNADIQFYHNVMQLVRDWYFIQAGPLDPRARKYPLPDDLMGELLSYVLAHEVGHTLGFQHNMKASSEYPVDKLRDPQWLKTMGHTPTLMDYSRFNYVAQPEDNVDPRDLIPKIGPYDIWATKWGYTPIPGAKTPDDELVTLDQWAREQDQKPYLRFSTANANGADAGDNTEAVGDGDAVYSTALGLKNLQRVMDMLLSATTHEGENWDELNLVYNRVLQQWSRELGHVAQIVGGFDSQEKHGGQDGVRFIPVSKARQQAAVKFLNVNAFATPAMFLRPDILRRIEPAGALNRIRAAQLSVLNSLMSTARFDRLVEAEAIDGSSAYRPSEFLGDLRKGIFSEIYAPQVKIDAFRRNLQRSYLDLISTRLNGAIRLNDDQRPMLRGELRTIAADASTALARATDRETRLHLEDLRDQAARILDPKFQQSTPAQNGPAAQTTAGESEVCWPDGLDEFLRLGQTNLP
jgi:hypothetical protein